MRHFLSFFLALVIFQACRKDPDLPVPPASPDDIAEWKVVDGISNNLRYIQNSFASGDSLFLFGQNYFSVYEPITNQITSFYYSYPTLSNPLLYSRPAMRSEFIVELYESGLLLRPTHNPVVSGSEFWLNIPAMDTSVHLFSNYFSSYRWENPAVSNLNEALIPFHHGSNGYPVVFRTGIRVLHTGGDQMDTAFVRKIVFNDPAFQNADAGIILPWNDKFFVNISGLNTPNEVVRLNADDSWESAGFQSPVGIYDLFGNSDSLFAVCGTPAVLYFSSDDGETWQPRFNLPNSWLNMDFFTLNGKSYASVQDQIFLVEINSNLVRLVELENKGLATNSITAVNLCGDSVYVSTLSGLFVKSLADFNTPRR